MRSLFSTDDWEEIIQSFQSDVKLVESDVPDAVIYFFDEVEKVIEAFDLLNHF